MGVEFDPRQRQQIVDQARHAGGLRLHDLEKPLARRGVVAGRTLQRLDETRQGRQRRPQFVTGVGDEVGPHLLGAAQRRQIVKRHQHQAPPPAAWSRPKWASRSPRTSGPSARDRRPRRDARHHPPGPAGWRRRSRGCARQPRPARRAATQGRSSWRRHSSPARCHAGRAQSPDRANPPEPSRSAARRSELPDARPAAARTATPRRPRSQARRRPPRPVPPRPVPRRAPRSAIATPSTMAMIDSTSRARLSRPSHSSRRAGSPPA